MFEVRDLKKTYYPKKGVPVEALRGIDLVFPEKGLIFILGKSGSGKSTLLHLMGCLDRPTEGEIVLDGTSSAKFTAADYDNFRGEYLGFVFQEYNLLNEFTVRENVEIGCTLIGRSPEKAGETLALVGLSEMADRKPMELSGGQRQRVAIARAICKDPKIIFADEPTGALDETTGREILDILKSLSAEKLIIVVTHDREFAETYGDRVIELADGRIVSDREIVHEEA